MFFVDNNSQTLSTYSDEKLIKIFRDGNTSAQDFLLNKYKHLVRIKSRSYFLIGSDTEDLIQEGMIGLYKAIRDFDENKDNSFKNFSELCITRQIISAIKSANRKKHTPLNNYTSLDFNETDDNNKTLGSKYLEKISNPEDIFIGLEEKQYIEKNLVKILSEFEYKVLLLYLKGESYDEIATSIDKTFKSVDNALQRIKKKVEKVLMLK